MHKPAHPALKTAVVRFIARQAALKVQRQRGDVTGVPVGKEGALILIMVSSSAMAEQGTDRRDIDMTNLLPWPRCTVPAC